jgi:ribosomal subunit interface protein
MQTTFTTKHFEDDTLVRGHFEEKAAKLKKHLSRFKDALVYLHGCVERNPHREECYATLSLYMPSCALHCRERGGDGLAALNAAFLDIARQIEKHKDKLNREKRRRER